MLTPNQETNDAERIGSRIGRIDPDNFQNQNDSADGLFATNDDESLKSEEDNSDNEPTDDNGEHDHHQDDNYALGGHVTRSGSV